MIDSFSNTLEIKYAQDPYLPDAISLELLHPKGDKVHALTYLADKYDVIQKSVTVFGDNLNDVGMGKFAGRCIAVKNAIKEFQLISDIVLPHTNDGDAVAKFLAKENGLEL